MYIKNGNIVDELRGEYDCFGGVFIDEPSKKDGSYEFERTRDFWKTDWDQIQSSILDVFNEDEGICAVHEKCINDSEFFVPVVSEIDPDDGSGLYIKR